MRNRVADTFCINGSVTTLLMISKKKMQIWQLQVRVWVCSINGSEHAPIYIIFKNLSPLQLVPGRTVWVRTGILDTGIIPVSVGPAGIPVCRLPTGIGQWDRVAVEITRSMVRTQPAGQFCLYFFAYILHRPSPGRGFFSHFNGCLPPSLPLPAVLSDETTICCQSFLFFY